MEKILITGISSFVGFYLARKFSKTHEVVGIISKKIEEYQGIEKRRLDLLKKSISFERIDLEDSKELQSMIINLSPTYCIHHAGYAKNYGSSNYDYEKSLRVNVRPLPYIFESLKKINCKGILITGTCMEYSDSNNLHDENEKCNPSTAYGKSKLLETLEAKRLSDRFNIPTRVIRIFNPYGKYEMPDKLIPYLIYNIKNNRSVDLTSCEQFRSFINVNTISNIYSFMLGHLQNDGFEIFNAVLNEKVRLKDFILMLVDNLNIDKSLLNFGVKEMRATEVTVCCGSNKKLCQSGYKLNLTLPEEIQANLSDYR